MRLVEILTHGGKLMADISDNTCLKFGFKRGDVIETCFGEEAIVVGVASIPAGRNAGKQALFYEKDDGISYYFNPGNLKDAGFRLRDFRK